MIWFIQTVSEKHFCHSQISMICLQNFSVTFYIVSNLLSISRPEMVLQLTQPRAWPEELICLKKCVFYTVKLTLISIYLQHLVLFLQRYCDYVFDLFG